MFVTRKTRKTVWCYYFLYESATKKAQQPETVDLLAIIYAIEKPFYVCTYVLARSAIIITIVVYEENDVASRGYKGSGGYILHVLTRRNKNSRAPRRRRCVYTADVGYVPALRRLTC